MCRADRTMAMRTPEQLLTRRGFLAALGIGAAAAVVVPELVLEPRRRFWQVSRNAPIRIGSTDITFNPPSPMWSPPRRYDCTVYLSEQGLTLNADGSAFTLAPDDLAMHVARHKAWMDGPTDGSLLRHIEEHRHAFLTVPA